MNELPEIIPVFPLSGAILLPTGNLPLNIFEPRYVDMLKHARETNNLIGMIQKKENDEGLYSIGCVGKIDKHFKSDTNTYFINLHGLKKFTIVNEIKSNKRFRTFNVKYDENEEAFNDISQSNFNKKAFFEKLLTYSSRNNLNLDSESLEKINIKSLIIMLAMACPFKNSEKQFLLESKNLDILIESLVSLLNFSNLQKFKDQHGQIN
tara:strand:- start:351 stop:974 length:624 start_codon:yes stop_codon:yes gene_type:complete